MRSRGRTRCRLVPSPPARRGTRTSQGGDTTRPTFRSQKPTPIAPIPEPGEDDRTLPFIDVNKGDWFFDDVYDTYHMGLINGRTPTTFVPEGTMTVAEAIKLAAVMNQKYTDGKVTLGNGEAPTWYSTYVDYCVAKGIIEAGTFGAEDMNRPATRAEYVQIFAKSLPDEALPVINSIGDDKIPDVKLADSYGPAVYKFYRAGILNGVDAAGNFAPQTFIKRSEVAAIVNRMMNPEKRVSITL